MIYSAIIKKARLAIRRPDQVIDDIRPAYGEIKTTFRKDGKYHTEIVINGDLTDWVKTISNAITIDLKNGDKIVYIAKEDEERTQSNE